MKRLFALILVLIMALSMVACGNETNNGDDLETNGQSENQSSTDDSKGSENGTSEDKTKFDTAWAANEFEALLPELPFSGWVTKQEGDNTYEMELTGLNTSAATNPPDSGEPDGADKTKLKNYLNSLSAYGFTVEETGTDFKWLVIDADGNKAEFKCGDGGCWITIEKIN